MNAGVAFFMIVGILVGCMFGHVLVWHFIAKAARQWREECCKA
jgi:hypothetical protein